MDLPEILRAARAGDEGAITRAFGMVYDELRSIAHRQLRRLRPGETLGTTALVHEAFLKLARARLSPEDAGHFYALAARAMRQILVDAARARPRGASRRFVSLDEEAAQLDVAADDMLGIDDALRQLEALDPRLAQVVELRYFGGLTEEEVAVSLGTSARTVRRDWRKARAFLHEVLQDANTPEDPP